MRDILQTVRQKGRPNAPDYIAAIFPDFIPLSGDRLYGDDPAVCGGIAPLAGHPVTVIGQCRGRNLEESLRFHFSMPRPEGYRKALRLMEQAEKFHRPVVCLVDTLGAFPGKEAEDRGQAGAIAACLQRMMHLRTPILSLLIGEGGSGGALAFCVSDEIAALENALLSVISPRGCASILWKDSSREQEAARVLGMTADDLKAGGVVDVILPEPVEGAHTSPELMAQRMEQYLVERLQYFRRVPVSRLVKRRFARFRSMGGQPDE